MKAIKTDLDLLRSDLSRLMERFTVIAPAMADNRLDYLPITDPAQLVLTDELPYKSPKEAVFPRVENILRFSENEAELAQEIRPILLIGAKPCDLEALRITDAIFTGDQGNYKDPFYGNRRRVLTVVGMGCETEKPGCFCAPRGLDRGFSQSCDAFLSPEGDGLTLRILTPAGEGLFTGTETEADAPPAPPEATLRVTADEKELFETMPWETYAEGCLGCGTCTYLCPTCHCFELKDTALFGDVLRRRLWDSCMYPRFTLHSSGHNPRPSKRERWRQRVMHKYVYLPQNYGVTACTGCGRCIRSCPGGLSIKNTVLDILKRTGGSAE